MARHLPYLLAFAMLAGCSAPTLAPLPPTHPASPDAAEAPVTPPPAALATSDARAPDPPAQTMPTAHRHHAH